MNLFLIDACLIGLFAFAAIHYATQWWLSRHERVLLVFAIQCALYVAVTMNLLSRHRTMTIGEAQAFIERTVSIGMFTHIGLLQLYASFARRRDRLFRIVVTGVLMFIIIVNLWTSVRGTVIELRAVQPLLGGTVQIAIVTPPGALLALLYLTVFAVELYGLFVARAIWKRGDRAGAVCVVLATLAVMIGALTAILVDFAGVQTPYLGTLPHAVFVLFMAALISREYAARAAREVVAKRKFETIFEHAPIGMALLSPDGVVLRVNRSMCSMVGRSADELQTRHIETITGEMGGSLAELLAGRNETYATEKSFLRKDGERVWSLLAVSRIADEHGQPSRIVCQMQDVTELRAHRHRLEELVATRTSELRAAKDEAERANAAKSDFLAQMSHETRTPLNVMMLYGQLLHRDQTIGEPQRKKLEIILSSGRHLATILTDVLEMSKIEAGHVELVEDRFDLGTTLDEVERMFAAQTAAEGITLTLERPALCPSRLGDGGKVKQILLNLVGNAVKFTKRGGIRITASERIDGDEHFVTIAVADTGVGIAAADYERIFQPFEQLAPGARAGGTGLGLAISRTHARMMRGDLKLTSELGAGSTFTFTFVTRHVEPAVKLCKVLVVDDVQHNREALVELLAQPLYDTRTAADGPRALEIHADWFPDVVLMDLRMPQMDGLEAVRRLRAAGSKAAIGVLTASTQEKDEEVLAVGADFFLRKPYDERELRDRIARAVRDRASLP